MACLLRRTWPLEHSWGSEVLSSPCMESDSSTTFLKNTREHETTVGSRPALANRKHKSLRRRNRHPIALAIVAIAALLVVGVYFLASPYLVGPPFPYSTGENWIHVHPYLAIDIDGTNITIPAGVGIFSSGLEPIHTHDSSGLLHVELAQADARSHNYTLGDFFAIWNYTVRTIGASEAPTLNGRTLPVEFSSTDILGFHSNSTYQIILLVDGHPSTQWGSLNIERLDYCSTANTGPPCCPTDCAAAGGPASNPYWNGSTDYPYGYGHTIVIEYTKVA